MAVLKMQRISICALKKDRKAILEKLQRLGVLEVAQVAEEDELFQKMDTSSQRMKFEKAAASADQALEILEKYVPEKKSMLASLEGKQLIEPEKEKQVQKNGADMIQTAGRIYNLDRERAEQLAMISKLENNIESLQPWMKLDVPLQPTETRRTVLILGSMPGETTLESVYTLL